MYQPSQDSSFLSETLRAYLKKEKNKNIKILDMGSGSGIQAETCINLGFKNILCADIDTESINYLKNKFNKLKSVKIIKSNLFSNISKSSDFDDSQKPQNSKNFDGYQSHKTLKSKISEVKGKFDLIIFNPPYLAENKYDKQKDTSGGRKGDETILAFLQQAKKHLNEQGKILLLLSSLTPRKRINKLLIKLKYKKETLATQKLFFENLEIWLIS